MPLRVNTNISGINTRRHIRITNTDLTKRIERLSSGLRVNRAADDAAGLSVSEGLRAEISGFLQGIRNSEQATNLLQVAEGALNEVNGLLIRMRELAVQSANSTINNTNRESLNAEFTQLINEVDRIAQVTSYNNTSLLSGYGNAVSSNLAASTALASATTGVVATQITGASAGTYTFIDNTADAELTARKWRGDPDDQSGPGARFRRYRRHRRYGIRNHREFRPSWNPAHAERPKTG